MKNNISIIIPARVNSSRVPKKLLYKFNGLTAIAHTIRKVKSNNFNLPVFIATPDKELIEIAKTENIPTILTSSTHHTGTSRCVEAASKISSDYIIIVQGDELLFRPEIIDSLYIDINKNSKILAWNITANLEQNDYNDESVVKCTVDKQNIIIDCFRTYNKIQNIAVRQLQGVMAFQSKFLIKEYANLNSKRSYFEKIEQLVLTDNQIHLKSLNIEKPMRSLNTFDDIITIKKCLGVF